MIAAGEEFGEFPEVKATRDEVAHQAAVEEICERLYKATTELDQEQLSYGLSQAEKLKVDETKYEIVPVAREYLSRIVETRKLMQEATQLVEESALIYAIEARCIACSFRRHAL